MLSTTLWQQKQHTTLHKNKMINRRNSNYREGKKNNCLGSWHPSASTLSASGSTNLESQSSERSTHFAWIQYDTISLRYLRHQSLQTQKANIKVGISNWIVAGFWLAKHVQFPVSTGTSAISSGEMASSLASWR